MAGSKTCAALVWTMLFGSAAMDAQAATTCVTTSTGLQTALSSAQANGEPDDIRLRAGFTYTSSSPSGFTANIGDGQGLLISGGWNAGCMARNAGARSNIDGQELRPGLILTNGASSGVSTWRVANLNFISGNGASIASGLGIQAINGASTFLSVENNSFLLNINTGNGAGGAQLAVSGGLVMRGNLFSGNQGVEGAGTLICNAGGAKLSHNTVTGNDSSNQFVPTGGFRLIGNCNYDIDNNLFWMNQQPDLRDVVGMTLQLRNNNYDQLVGPSLPTLEVGKRNIDPQFSGWQSGMLKPNSPMVDAGFVNPPAGLPPESLDGGPRITQIGPDIGAFELDVVLHSGFE